MKLVLFDIDGTLIFHVGQQRHVGWTRFLFALNKIYKINANYDKSKNYNGWVDRSISWDIVKPHGVSKVDFDRKFHRVANEFYNFALKQARNGEQLYRSIPDAVELARRLKDRSDIRLGLMTGNVEKMAWWKLNHSGINNLFKFGVFGDQVDDRIALARSVFSKAMEFYKQDFQPEDIIVIGDAISDIKAAKSINAGVIVVTTGHHTDKKDLESEEPDLIVDSLMDQKVFEFIKSATKQ